MTSPHSDDESARSGRTPSAPDVDQPEGGAGRESGRTASAPDVDQPDGGADQQGADKQ